MMFYFIHPKLTRKKVQVYKYKHLYLALDHYDSYVRTGADSDGGARGSVELLLTPFHGKILINLIYLGYHIYPTYLHPLHFTLYMYSSTSPFHHL